MAYIPQYHPPYIDREVLTKREMRKLDIKREKKIQKAKRERQKENKWIKKHTEKYYERLWNELKDLLTTRMEINKPSDEPLPSDNVRKLGAYREDRIILMTMNAKEKL